MTIVDNTSSVTNILCYDAMGRVSQGNQVTQDGIPPVNYTYPFNSYLYNSAGMLTSETLPSGKVIGMNIDTAGRVAGVYKTGAYYVGAVETDATNRILYAPQGAIAQMRLGSNLWDQTRYNKRLQPTQMGVGTTTISLDSALTTTVANRLLIGNCYSNVDPNCSAAGTANNNGNVLRQMIQAPSLSLTQIFTYDGLNRLATGNETGGSPTWTQTYGYDRYGNRAVTGAGDYIPAPALTPIDPGAYYPDTNKRNSAGYAYDASGNMITEATTRTMTYDAENRMVTFNGGSGTTTYTYDGDGRRVKKDSGGVKSIYVYDALGRMAAEYSSAAFSGPGGTSYVSANHLGSTRLVINPDYTVRGRHDYLPFGEEIGTDKGGRSSIPGYGAIEFRQKFTSKERDPESNLDFFMARYFSGAQGRFMSVDPSRTSAHHTDPQSWNRYSYAQNSPLKFIDKDGKCSSPAIGLGQVGICIDLFISTRTLESKGLKLGRLGYGDNRGPTGSDLEKRFRQEIKLTITPGVSIIGTAAAGISKTMIGPDLEGKQNTQMRVESDQGGMHIELKSTAINGYQAAGLPGPEGTIQTDIKLNVTPEGKVGVEGGERTQYPALEVYKYETGKDPVQILYIPQSKTPDDLTKGPIQKIPPIVPQ